VLCPTVNQGWGEKSDFWRSQWIRVSSITFCSVAIRECLLAANLSVSGDLVKPALPLSVLLIGFSRLPRVLQKFCLTGTFRITG